MPKGNDTAEAALIDYSARSPGRHFTYDLKWGSSTVCICRCTFLPTQAKRIGAAQFIVALHRSAALTVEWASDPTESLQQRTIHTGDLCINSANRPLLMRWSDPWDLTVIAIEKTFLNEILRKEFGNTTLELPPLIGVKDPIAQRLVEAADAQLDKATNGESAFAESVATALIVHLFRAHHDARMPRRTAGGLAPRHLRQILEYIDDSLTLNLEVMALAKVVGLSVKHFAECFTKSMGVSPHRYVTQRRIQKAKKLLLNGKLTTAEIAECAGFSSQSHFTVSFRRFVGMPPARFRRDSGL